MNELIVKPMLAQKVGVKEPTEEQWKEGLYLQPKLDGVRCLIQCNKENGKGVITAYSRTGKIWKNIDHILKEAIPFFRKYPNIVLDGELYNNNYRDNFEKIISLVRKTKPTDEDKLASKKAIKFYIYDVISPVGGLDNEPILGENSNDNYFRRCGFIRSNFNGAKAPNCFKVLNHELVYNE